MAASGQSILRIARLRSPGVGWINTNAIFLTFNLGSAANVTSVGIDFLKETQDFTFLPDSVSINGQLFPVDPNALGNPATGFLTFAPVGLSTQTVQIEIDRANTGFHILIDEVTFDGSPVSSAAPEPVSACWAGRLSAGDGGKLSDSVGDTARLSQNSKVA